MKLTLHVGTEKTGTKTLQSWFSENRDPLRAQGVLYPRSLGTFNHRSLAIFARDPDKPDDGFRQRKIRTVDEHQGFCSALLADFTREFDQCVGVRHWFVSSEHLHSRLTTAAMVERVQQFFGDRFTSTQVVVHLRPQVDVAVSLASTAARVGLRVDPQWLSRKSPTDAYYNYDLLVRRWESVFGADAVLVVPFQKTPNLTSLLIERLAIDPSLLAPLVRKNEALDWRSMALVNALGAAGKAADPDAHLRGLFLDDWPVREPLQVGIDMARQFQSVFDQSNADLIARRPELQEGDLTPNWAKYDAAPNIQALESLVPFGEHLRYLITRLNVEVMLERCAKELAEGGLAAASGNVALARAHLHKVTALVARIPPDEATAARLAALQRRATALSERL